MSKKPFRERVRVCPHCYLGFIRRRRGFHIYARYICKNHDCGLFFFSPKEINLRTSSHKQDIESWNRRRATPTFSASAIINFPIKVLNSLLDFLTRLTHIGWQLFLIGILVGLVYIAYRCSTSIIGR